MVTRTLGKSGIAVAPLAFGGNVFGWTVDEDMSFQLLDHFVASGFNLIDTADIYSTWVGKPGISETIIGKWLKHSGKRNQVVIATKVGLEMSPEKKGLRRGYIVAAVEESLKRLQTDRIDLYQAHRDDPDTPVEETLGAFADLVRDGKVTAIGASNFSVVRLAESLRCSTGKGFPAYQSLQPEYNLYSRASFEAELESFCRQHGLGVIPYFSLASGFLSGKYRSEADLAQSQRGSGVKKYLNPRGFRILAALDEVAARYTTTPAAVALAWLIARPSITAPIASATSIAQLDELMSAAKLHLDAQAMNALDQASTAC
jgi:aryl-alcohol dehydrogenase-like predicted oxidoreductase